MTVSRRRRERLILLTWGMVGLGLGLMSLSTMLWLRQTGWLAPRAHMLAASTTLAEPLAQLRAGQVPTAQSPTDAWAPLWAALHALHRQRAEALSAYEAKVGQAALSDWMLPAQLVRTEGRAALAQRLTLLEQALHAWAQREAMVQIEFDGALNAWFEQAPDGLNASARQQMAEASGDTTRALHDYVQLAQALVTQIHHLSGHIENLGGRVSLAPTSSGKAQELLFSEQLDLNRYQSSVSRLAELAEQEQAQMARIRQLDHQHMARLAQAIESAFSGPLAP